MLYICVNEVPMDPSILLALIVATFGAQNVARMLFMWVKEAQTDSSILLTLIDAKNGFKH